MRITLLTDFGTADGYVAAMKGAIAQIAPSALIDDASHAIEPGDVFAGALALRRYWKMYPEGTVHIVVIDPGVGGERRALAAKADGRYLVGPDNGVLSLALSEAAECVVFEVAKTQYAEFDISPTFHGRDIFAPVAAHLAVNADIEKLGPRCNDPLMLIIANPLVTDTTIHGEIVGVDRFGNLMSNIRASLIRNAAIVHFADRNIAIVDTYEKGERGEPLALINSDGYLEVAVREGSAAKFFGVGRGTDVDVLKT